MTEDEMADRFKASALTIRRVLHDFTYTSETIAIELTNLATFNGIAISDSQYDNIAVLAKLIIKTKDLNEIQ